MVRRCCVSGCVRKKDDNVSVYRFPSVEDPERERWLKAIPVSIRKSELTDESVVCSRHWPDEVEMTKIFGKVRPVHPPTLFNGKQINLPPLRTTTKSLAETRRPLPVSFNDQHTVLKDTDSVSFEKLQASLIDEKKQLPLYTTVFMMAGILFVQSLEFICGGIPKYLIKIFPSLKFETFHGGVKCFVSSLTANRITKLDTWSRFEEAVRYLKFRENSRQQDFFLEQVHVMQPQVVGKSVSSVSNRASI